MARAKLSNVKKTARCYRGNAKSRKKKAPKSRTGNLASDQNTRH